jgi:hypothetical protein
MFEDRAVVYFNASLVRIDNSMKVWQSLLFCCSCTILLKLPELDKLKVEAELKCVLVCK